MPSHDASNMRLRVGDVEVSGLMAADINVEQEAVSMPTIGGPFSPMPRLGRRSISANITMEASSWAVSGFRVGDLISISMDGTTASNMMVTSEEYHHEIGGLTTARITAIDTGNGTLTVDSIDRKSVV